ncbi:MAG TPA: thiol-activated cytolysin family protein, partial [Gemmatimonadales bacterium]|nr:thiol-activated cytolysin family protein [Gemmatimonadales bacterium]
ATRYKCVSSPYSITRTPDKIVTMDPDVNVLWLGALLQGKGYKQGIGSMQEWAVRERAPLEISVDLLDGANSATVTDPDLASVTQAIGKLVSAAEAAHHRGGTSVSYSMEKNYSLRQAGMSLGLSTNYFGPTISASFSIGRNASETGLTAYFVQRMFTASIVLPNQPADFFSDKFTPDRLQEERDRGHIAGDNIPVYVANIVYGRSLLFTMTSATTNDSLRIALAASAGADSGSLDVKLQRILETSRIAVATIGGESKNATQLIQSGKLADYFQEPAALTSARPISYTIRNVGDNSIAKVSESTEYDLKTCEAIPTTGRINLDVTPNDASVSILGPGGYSFGPQTGDQLLTDLVPGGYAITVSRAGFDTATTDVSIAAGDAIDVPMTLEPINQTATGAIYDIAALRVDVDATGCTGESQADVYHATTVNGKTLTNRPEADPVPLYAGEWDDRNKGPNYFATVRDTVWLTGSRTSLHFFLSIWDDDGVINPADPMASSNWYYNTPNIPVGLNLIRSTGGYPGCSTRFEFNLTKVADMFTPAP